MAEITTIIWSDEPGENLDHVAEHGVTPEEVDAVIRSRIDSRQPSDTHPRHWVVDGFTPAGRALRVVFVYIEDLDIVIPVTAFERTRKEF